MHKRKYLYITDQITWWLVVWSGGQGSKSGSTAHVPQGSFLYKNTVLLIETIIKFEMAEQSELLDLSKGFVANTGMVLEG